MEIKYYDIGEKTQLQNSSLGKIELHKNKIYLQDLYSGENYEIHEIHSFDNLKLPFHQKELIVHVSTSIGQIVLSYVDFKNSNKFYKLMNILNLKVDNENTFHKTSQHFMRNFNIELIFLLDFFVIIFAISNRYNNNIFSLFYDIFFLLILFLNLPLMFYLHIHLSRFFKNKLKEDKPNISKMLQEILNYQRDEYRERLKIEYFVYFIGINIVFLVISALNGHMMESVITIMLLLQSFFYGKWLFKT